jgi:hypothetical protein
MSDRPTSFPLGAWVARQAIVACAAVTLVPAAAQLRAATAEAPRGDAGTAGAPRSERESARERARVLAQQYLRQIQALRRAELDGRLDRTGEALLEALEQARDAALQGVVQDNHATERRDLASIRHRLDEIGAALTTHQRSGRRRPARGRT